MQRTLRSPYRKSQTLRRRADDPPLTGAFFSLLKYQTGFDEPLLHATKTHITPPSRLKYLGFGFWKDKNGWKARPHEDSVEKFKRKLKHLCKRKWSVDLTYRIKKINEVTRGWINYFRIGSMKQKLQSIDEHLRRMLRVIIWKQWKTAKKREWGLLSDCRR